MQSIFNQQAALIRKVLQGHVALRRAWNLSQEKILGGPEGEMITLGEGRLAAELRAANDSLRSRLQNKDKLIEEMLARQKATVSDLEAAKAEIEKLKNMSRHALSPKQLPSESRRSSAPAAPGERKRRRSPSPGQRRSPSPGRRRSPSPGQRRSPSPGRRRSPSPGRKRST